MAQTLTEIAQQLRDANKKMQLIYAFNGMGKTRLSRELKDLVSPNTGEEDPAEFDESELASKTILYYSAFTEDLFYWDNDLNNDEQRKLKIHPNAFTKWVFEEQGQDQNVITNFQSYADDKLTPHFNAEYVAKDQNDNEFVVKAFSEVTFTHERGGDEVSENIKISKGEESNFIWSIFHSLLELVISVLNVAEPEQRETDQFNRLEYIFIDDPVSSLDENHLIQLAVNLGQLIKSSEFTNGQGLKFIISTHNPLFYNVLYNELGVKEGYILSLFDNGTFELDAKRGDSNRSFAHHLHIKHLIQQAIDENNVQRYHFALLRNLYEKTASFLGYQRWSELLPGDKQAYASRIMNFYPHSSLSNEQMAEPTGPERAMVSLLLENLNNYGYWQQEEPNG